MIEQTLEIGPFTPQETDHICEKLRAQGVPFELLKDEETEKAEMKNDYANLVKKTELRVETYLGQVFYLKMTQANFDKVKSLLSEYGLATAPKENPEELNSDMKDVAQESKDQKKLQQILAISVLFLLGALALYGYFNN